MYTINRVMGFEDLYVLEPKKYYDDRGYFQELYNVDEFKSVTGISFKPVQENESSSKQFVVRGLHFQNEPYSQAKLVRCTEGSIIDVALDIRNDSPTRGKLFSIYLSKENNKQLFIPKGYAHGFIAISPNNAVIRYLTDNNYAPSYEGGVQFDEIFIKDSINNAISFDFSLIAASKLLDSYSNNEFIFSEKDINFPRFY